MRCSEDRSGRPHEGGETLAVAPEPARGKRRQMTGPRILDLGCGNRKRPGTFGIDVNPRSAADLVHDLNRIPYPLPDSSFDEIYLDNVLEHLENVIPVMEELHRLARPGALVKIIVPYFRARWACIDPTHRHFFTVDSFSYFDPRHPHCKVYDYSLARFEVEVTVFNETIRRGWFTTLVKAVANKWPWRYEKYLSHLYPLDDLSFYLRVLK